MTTDLKISDVPGLLDCWDISQKELIYANNLWKDYRECKRAMEELQQASGKKLEKAMNLLHEGIQEVFIEGAELVPIMQDEQIIGFEIYLQPHQQFLGELFLKGVDPKPRHRR